MLFRHAKQEEIPLLFHQGYQEWSKNRTFEQYCIDNSKEDTVGTRYVLENHGEIVCSTIVIRLETINCRQVLGIGSVLTPQNHRGNNYAAELLRNCINLVYDRSNLIFLYSDIKPSFYERMNFRMLPTSLQRYEKSLCMVFCHDKVWSELLNLTIESIPSYF